jgi:Fe-S-cluster-containing dehydrogenase component
MDISDSKRTAKIDPYISKPMTRRDFIREGAAGILSFAAVVAVGDLAWSAQLADGAKIALAKGAVLADKSLCSGCRICEMVCSNVNSEGRNASALALVILDKDYMTGDYTPRTCFQCLDPPCFFDCPVDALKVDKKSRFNTRVIDTSICIGCQQCRDSCGEYFAVPRPSYDVENNICMKCHLCWGDPNCVKYCPTGALRFEKSEKGLRIGYPIMQGV